MTPIQHTSIDLTDAPAAAAYRLLTGCVVPRPIALVSTVAADGTRNLAPFSFFNLVSARPPTLMLSVDLEQGREEKDTAHNIRLTGEFVVNLVSEPMLERMVASSLDWPGSVDEFERAGFSTLPSTDVAPPRAADSPVNLECRLAASFELGESTAFFGQIVRAHVDAAALDDGKVDSKRVQAVGRLAGIEYCTTREIQAVPRGETPGTRREAPVRREAPTGLTPRPSCP